MSRGPGLRAMLLALLIASAGVPALGSRTLVFTEQVENLEAGETSGVAVSAQGRLFLSPRLVRVGELGTAGDPVHVWDMTADATGAVYLGTGPDGRVLRVSPTGRTTTFVTLDEPMVTALLALPDGHLLVAAAPGGRIYRVDADGRSELWCETEERYVWALAAGPGGMVYAGTGEGGMVLEIAPSGQRRVFFDSDDAHIVSLVALPDGGLLAGGAGLGLVYRLDRDGHARVLYDDALPEVSALAVESDGSVLAALVAPPAPESRSPALRIRLPDGTQVGGDSVTSFDDESAPMLRGVIEGLPAPEPRPGSATRGQLVRIHPSGAVTTLWRSSDEVPLALVAAGGRVLFGTGEPARLYRLEEGEDLARLSTLPEAQVTSLLGQGRSVLLATSNPATLYRMAGEAGDSGSFLSKPFDAGSPARWGSVRWQTTGTAGIGAEVYTRTGNSEAPDETWSAWSPALTVPERSAIVNPDGRYLQWRARFAGSHGDSARLSAVEVHYSPYNRPPRLREFYLDVPQPAVSDTATLRWGTYDPDDDPVETSIEFRALPGGDWQPIADAHEYSRPAAGAPGVEWRDDRVILDTKPMAEGDYEFRARVDDQAGNHPGDGWAVLDEARLSLTIDHTPPELAIRATGGLGFEFSVRDAYSDVRALEVREGERLRFSLRPVDGVCDSREELFRFELAADADAAAWSVRAIDSAGNKVEAPLTRTR